MDDQMKGAHELLAAASGWSSSLTTAWPAEAEEMEGAWVVGTIDEDENKYPVITVEADQYDAPGESEKIARALIALWAQAVATRSARAQPAPAGASHLHVINSVHEALPPNVAGRRFAVVPIVQTARVPEQSGLVEAERTRASFNAVITYILGDGYTEEPMEFLRCWNEGNFDALREEWPDAPLAIYYSDPLADHAAIDAALAAQGGGDE